MSKINLNDFINSENEQSTGSQNQSKSSCGCYTVLIVLTFFFVIIATCSFDDEKESANTNENAQTEKEIPVNERSFEALDRCISKRCSDEYKLRLKKAVSYVDSIYAGGAIREVSQLSNSFYEILKSDGSTINFNNEVPTIESIVKRIENLLPAKGCIKDSIQYANFLSTIYEVEKDLEPEEDKFDAVYKKYFSYLNRNCKLPHYDANVIITEERFIENALGRKDITSSKANALYNDIFKKIDENDFIAMKSVNEGKTYKGYGSIEKKKNRTISYVEAPSKEFNDATALAVAAFNIFSFEAYFPFTLHPSVENVEIGFNISELEYNLYAGYYHEIYAVTIKTSKKNLDKYYEKNNIVPPKRISSDNAMSEEDKNFFSQPQTYTSIKRWCSKKGFICSKYLVERTK